MINKKFAYLLGALLSAALLWGCGGAGGSSDGQVAAPAGGGNLGTDANGIFFTGSSSCAVCHQNPAVVGAEFTAPLEKYLQSKHLLHSTQISAAAPALCLNCHDPIGDGRTLQSFVPAANIPAGGLAAVGCENCHGAGGEHFGVAPVPNVTPDFTVCGNCHNAGLPVGPAGHVGTGVGGILENYQISRHASSVRGGATNPVCARCHSDEGFRQNFAATAGLEAADFTAFLNGVAAPAVRSAVQCRTCHDPHSGAMRAAATVDAATTAVVFSSEFNLCTSCHLVFLTTTFDEVSGTFNYQTDTARTHYLAAGHPTATALIEDTHFANAAGTVAGYNINAAAGNACTACHDPHGATKFAQATVPAIATEWGTSGHANYQGEPFGPGITQAACLKCHSGPQYGRFVQGVAPADLDPANGAQVVSCVACHDLTARDAAGTAFALGALRPVATVTFPSGAAVSLDAPSNLCMECHQGRSSKPTVDARIAAGNLSFSNIHYFAAAATLFGTEVQGGYEYAGRTYRGRNAFTAHTAFGAPDLTTCAGCHVRSAAGHTFLPPVATCTACHAGTTFPTLAGSPQINSSQIVQLKDQLLGLLTASGVVALDGFPYFQNITTEQQLKAAYNWQVADKEPCGYIHNGIYIRQLLFDSIADMGGTPVVPRP